MRTVRKIIIHCTATPEGRDVKASDVREWHKARGWSDIGYHWLVRLNGTVEKGRDEAKAGSHVKGHNADSIGICYAGGLAADGITPKDTRTDAQKTALLGIVADVLKRFPGAKVYGHRDFAAKACPCFDAGKEYGARV